ncbi:MAG: N-acetylmuramoyl-L-alanine amidase family protein, partial [Lishizhenia sp.]
MLKKTKTIHLLFFFLVSSSALLSQTTDIITAGIKKIVIDPGHGGHDPGCHGEHSQEKHVALAVGLKLGEYIKEKYPEIEVIFTRDKDVFVTLDERAKIANRNNADLFICIHANAASPKAYGAETYVLGLHRTESQQKIAERENSAILLEEDNEEKYKDFDMSPDAIIARQLQLSYYLDQSINFASKIQKHFRLLGRSDRGVRQAGFLVLYKTTMPSVLIETGFLTNREEEKFLSKAANQQLMANCIFKAFQEYKSEIEGVNELITDAKEINTLNSDTTSRKTEVEEIKQVEEVVDDAIYFKVQIETSKEQIALNDQRFEGLVVEEYVQDNLYKYTVGSFLNDVSGASNLRKELSAMGYKSSFVVAF